MARVILLVCFFFFLIEKHIVNLYGLIIHELIRTFVWIAGLKYLKLLSEISRVNFINLNAYNTDIEILQLNHILVPYG